MKSKGKLLIADDDKNILKSLSILLDHEFEKVDTLSNPNLIISSYQKESYDLVLLDMNFSAGLNTGNEGIFWLHEILKIDPGATVIFITAYGDINLAVKAMKQGATDFIIKPWNNEKLIQTIKSALKIRESRLKINKLARNNESLSGEINKPADRIIGSSDAMKEIFTVIDKVAATEANILITGENGTGKELIAKEIHRRSKRKSKPMITIDMGSIPEPLFESELFGHTRGAFTDAKDDKTGRLEIADGGTLFLDEISNLPLPLQAKLLTVLQKHQITPVGSNSLVPVDIRLITATNKNPEEMIQKGLFREDLFYRINTVQIELPPLRKRKEDIPEIAAYYLKTYTQKYEKTGVQFSTQAITILQHHDWPGNIRELKHTIEKAVILCSHNLLEPDDFMLKQKKSKKEWPLKFEEIEKKAIVRALENNAGKITEAARELGLTRQTLYNKIKKYNL
ncbi:MAG: sigma-54 dependent transcriptional regulator [Bacteroidales bacterium]|jgi:DNA-binding NtrC family response regulator|nr:sigma-54 dependent transcriptional regulator [Bacteroidales bacterium]